SAADVIDVLDSQRARRIEEPGATMPPASLTPPPDTDMDAARDRVRDLLSHVPMPVNDLIRMSDLMPAAVLTVLLELELAGVAERHPGARIALAPDA
ncbi:MAG: DNA-protecting protein DprA, partial [Sphingomonadales bacterium]